MALLEQEIEFVLKNESTLKTSKSCSQADLLNFCNGIRALRKEAQIVRQDLIVVVSKMVRENKVVINSDQTVSIKS